MLILSRRNQERILIGDDIVIQVTQIERDSVKIGIEAPKSVVILREELEPFEEKPA